MALQLLSATDGGHRVHLCCCTTQPVKHTPHSGPVLPSVQLVPVFPRYSSISHVAMPPLNCKSDGGGTMHTSLFGRHTAPGSLASTYRPAACPHVGVVGGGAGGGSAGSSSCAAAAARSLPFACCRWRRRCALIAGAAAVTDDTSVFSSASPLQ